MELAVDRHQVDDLLGLVPHVRLRQRRRVVRVEEQLDLERPLVAVDELDDRRAETRARSETAKLLSLLTVYSSGL